MKQEFRIENDTSPPSPQWDILTERTRSELPQLLSWTDCTPLLRDLQKAYVERVECEFSEMLRSISAYDQDVSGVLGAKYSELPSLGQRRLLVAPETRWRILKIRWNFNDNLAFLQRSINAELHLSLMADLDSTQTWTALGDVLILNRNGLREQILSPRIAETVVVDFDSPCAREVNSMRDIPFVPYNETQKTVILARLNAAMDIIYDASPATGEFLRSTFRTIVPRYNGTAPKTLLASSTPSHIGRAVFRNTHLMSKWRIINSLVHEAIHSTLFIYDIGDCYVRLPLAEQPTICSPWSGRLLGVHNYVHACFVWSGLAMFWARARSCSEIPGAVVRWYLAQSMLGFANNRALSQLEQHRRIITSPIIDCLHATRAALDDVSLQT